MKTTLKSLKKIPGVPCLYRHENGSYYGKKKLRGGKRPVKALVTADGENITDRKLAERALAAWIHSLTAPAPATDAMTFTDLWKKFLVQKSAEAVKTLEKCKWVKQCLDKDFPDAWRMRVVDFKPSHLAEFFAKRRTMKPSAFNEMTMHIKNVFEVAVGDGIIPTSPYAKVPKDKRRMKNVRQRDNVPTIEQCEAIVASIRSQQFADTADKSADMVALMHLAALGTAECIHADWAHVKWDTERLETKRQKTGADFDVPFYPHLKPFLVDLWERQEKPTHGPLFTILSPKQAIYNACKRLGLPSYSPRDLRKARIVWMLRKGVPVEDIAKWQGHKDNGVLIRRTYAWVITSLDAEHEKQQLAKMAG